MGGVTDWIGEQIGGALDIVDDVLGTEFGPEEQEIDMRNEFKAQQAKLKAELSAQLNSADAKERLKAEARMKELQSANSKEIASMKRDAMRIKNKQDAKHEASLTSLETKETPKFDKKKFIADRKRAIARGPIQPTRNPTNQTRPGSVIKPRTTSERRPQ